jgi:hypothetical protein
LENLSQYHSFAFQGTREIIAFKSSIFDCSLNNDVLSTGTVIDVHSLVSAFPEAHKLCNSLNTHFEKE